MSKFPNIRPGLLAAVERLVYRISERGRKQYVVATGRKRV